MKSETAENERGTAKYHFDEKISQDTENYPKITLMIYIMGQKTVIGYLDVNYISSFQSATGQCLTDQFSSPDKYTIILVQRRGFHRNMLFLLSNSELTLDEFQCPAGLHSLHSILALDKQKHFNHQSTSFPCYIFICFHLSLKSRLFHVRRFTDILQNIHLRSI